MIEIDPLSVLMGGLTVYMWLTNYDEEEQSDSGSENHS